MVAPGLKTARDLHIRGWRGGTTACAMEGHTRRDTAGVQVEGTVTQTAIQTRLGEDRAVG